MEQNPENSGASEIIRSTESTGRARTIAPASNQLQGYNPVVPPYMYMPSTGYWPAGATIATPAAMLANTLWTNSCLMSNAGYTVEQMVASNCAYYSACIAGIQTTIAAGINDPRWSVQQLEWRGLQARQSRNREDPKEVTSSFRGSRNVTGDHNMDSGRKSNQTSEGPVSDTAPPEVIPSKSTPATSNTTATAANQEAGPSNGNRPNGGSFSSKLFSGRSSKCAVHGSPEASDDKSHTTATALHKCHHTVAAENENNSSGKVHEASENADRPTSQPPSQEKAPELPYSGINLREWIELKYFNASKNDRLCLFRKIVEIVDSHHSRGVALMELRPSSFIMFKNGDVKYVGSLMKTELWTDQNQDSTKKRGLDLNFFGNEREKMQKVGIGKLLRPETSSISSFDKEKTTNEYSLDSIGMSSICNAQSVSTHEETSTRNTWLTISGNAQLEKKWYAFPEKFKIRDLLSLNIYSLGILLFELLCQFDSIEEHTTAMSDLHRQILPPRVTSESPEEAGLCLWLLHPEPSSCPTTREILQSELIPGTNLDDDEDEISLYEIMNDIEAEILHHFLVSLKQRLTHKANKVKQSLDVLNVDLKEIESRKAALTGSFFKLNGHKASEGSTSKTSVHRDKLLGKVNELEDIYFSLRSHSQLAVKPGMDRLDMDVLTVRDRLPWVKDPTNLPTAKENTVDRIGIFFEGVCKYARYSKFEVCGTLKTCDILNSNNVVSSLCFDRDGQYIAAAGASKKIKVFEFGLLLDDSVDVHYPILEMSGNSKLNCICWNTYIKNYLVSADYDGLLQLWSANTGQEFMSYNEHRKTTWSVDFSRVDPTKFASGGEDSTLKIWNINEKKSVCSIWNNSTICSVQYSPYSSHLVAFGSSDYKVSCYDLRHTKIPWCTLTGHDRAVSFVKFLDSETIVTAAIDNKLKLWDLKKTSLGGSSPDACTLTYKGHVNDKHFLGLSVSDGYIACGSETNEVYAYYRSLPMPIATHKFGNVDPISGEESTNGSDGCFVSSVCWKKNSQMLVAANSKGTMKVLRMV